MSAIIAIGDVAFDITLDKSQVANMRAAPSLFEIGYFSIEAGAGGACEAIAGTSTSEI